MPFNRSGAIPLMATNEPDCHYTLSFCFQSLRRDTPHGNLRRKRAIERLRNSFNRSGAIPLMATGAVPENQPFPYIFQSLRRDTPHGNSIASGGVITYATDFQSLRRDTPHGNQI